MSEHRLAQVERSRVRLIAFGWAGTLFDELTGMQATLAGLVPRSQNAVDLEAMALVWRKEIWRGFRGKYKPWPELASRALERTFRAHRLPSPGLDAWDIQNEVLAWPMVPDQNRLGRLGRRFRTAILTQQDRPTIGPCLRGLARACDMLVSSDLSREFKPSVGYFKLLRAQLEVEEPDEVLIVSTDTYADLDPAAVHGYQTVHIRLHDEDDEEDTDDALPELGDVVRFLG